MQRARSVSKAMMAYLKSAREHQEYLVRETKEFDRGKRHLANMMGINSQEMTQDDIDDAIRYLFPSGLFDKRARPFMKHPSIVLKAQKEAQFDEDGRPKHYLFYTGLPNYYETLSRLANLHKQLNDYEDEQLARGVLDSPDDARYNFNSRQWIDSKLLSEKFIEPITDHLHQFFIKTLDKLVQHPYSQRAKDVIEEFSLPLPDQTEELKLPEIKRDENTGQIYTEILSSHREHVLNVKTVLNGSGVVKINGCHDILFLEAPYHRRTIFDPIALSGMVDQIDIIADMVRQPKCLGQTAVAVSIRYAVATSIAAYSDKNTLEKLRIAGLLTFDPRKKERKKFNQEGARRKYTWKKR